MKIIKYPSLIFETIEIPYYSAIDKFLCTLHNSAPFSDKIEPTPLHTVKINGKMNVSEAIVDIGDEDIKIGDHFSELIIDNIKMINVYVISINNKHAILQMDFFKKVEK